MSEEPWKLDPQLGSAVSGSLVTQRALGWTDGGSVPGLFVAAMMKTCRRVSKPSISVSSWLTTRTLAPDYTHAHTHTHREYIISYT